MSGMNVLEQVQKLPKGKAYLTYLSISDRALHNVQAQNKKGVTAGMRAALHGKLHEIWEDRGSGKRD
jgi:hypothetical protein